MLDLAIFTALGWERRAVTAGLSGVAAGDRPRTWLGRLGDGGACLVVQTGMGPDRARVAAAAVPPARLFLVCGCAGALVDWLRPGDLVAAERVLTLDRGGGASDRLTAGGDAIAALAARRGFRVHLGTVVSTPAVLASAEAKAAARACGALVVEMESAGVAAEARARGVPFLAVRVVLDRMGQRIPPALTIIDQATGGTPARRAVAALALRPWLWPAAGRLARQTQIADRRLRALMATLLAAGVETLAPVRQSASAAGS